MKQLTFIVVLASLAMASCGGKGSKSGSKGPQSDSLSTALSILVAENIKKAPFKDQVDGDKLSASLSDALGGKAKVTQDQADMFMRSFSTGGSQNADSLNLCIGVLIAENIKTAPFFKDISTDVFSKGFKDAFAGKASMTQEKCAEYVQAYEGKMLKEMEGEKKTKEDEFMKANGQKQGVTTTASGLQYEVMKAGTGAKPSATSTVKVHYHGTTLEGTVFDSSVERGEPVSFPLGNVIPGWTEGLQLMPVGSKYKFYIPFNLAYGAQAPSPKIQPYSTLIFEVELLEIEK